MKKKLLAAFITFLLIVLVVSAGFGNTIQVRISVAEKFQKTLPSSGRMILIFGNPDDREPRYGISWPGHTPVFGLDIENWDPKEEIIIQDREDMIGFRKSSLREIDPGNYLFQVLYDVDTTFSYSNAHGNYYSEPVAVNITGTGTNTIEVELNRQIEEQVPESAEFVKFVKIRSELLSEFWRKPVFLRAGILLPSGFYKNPEEKYPVRYNIGGYHSRYTRLQRKVQRDPEFMKWWLSEEAPQMIVVYLDGEAPFGDSYQMNSENNGPYSDATMRELIPHIEKEFRGIGTPGSRFLDGGSTGGWVVLALQIFYPEFFNGAWSTCSDPVDFHNFQLVNIYEDEEAYYNQYGLERPGMRTTSGEPVFTIKQEVQLENVLGRKNSYIYSGGQWGGWNAVYSHNIDGSPTAIWDPQTGVINQDVAADWKKYDIKEYLEKNWERIGPMIQGKIRIWMGDMDSFHLNNAMRSLEEFLVNTQNPVSDAFLSFGPGKGHCGHRISEREVMEQMMDRFAGR